MGKYWKLTPTQYILWLVDFVPVLGISIEQLLMGTGLNAACLNAPKLQISAAQHVGIIKNLIRFSNDPAVGLTVGLKRFIGTLDHFGYALMSCATFREALQIGTKYQRVVGRFSGRQLTMSFFQEGDVAVIQVDDDPVIGDFRVFAIEEIFGCTIGQSRLVTGKPLQLISVHCRYSPRTYLERYQQVFRCPVYFDAPYNQLRFDARLLNDPLPQASSYSASIYRARCDEMVAQMDDADDELVLRVRHAILSHPQACPGSDEVAAKLCISERSLRRKLRDSGVCFQQILDDIRLGIAKNYLTTSQRSVESISRTVGFDDPTSFSRAFKRWAGVSPRQFRGNIRLE